MVRRLVISLVGVVVIVFGLFAANLVAGNVPSLGLDLQGGASITLQPEGEYDAVALDVAINIIRSRVDSIGVAEPEIIRQGDTVVVNLPGVDDQQRALDIIGRQGQVLLRPVLQAGTLDTSATTTLPGQTTLPSDSTLPGAASGPGNARVRGAATTTIPAASETTAPGIQVSEDPNDPSTNAVLSDGKGGAFLVGPAGADGLVFTNDATAEINNGNWVVNVGLQDGPAGADLWNALTTKCFNRDAVCPTGQIAIVLDGKVISAPVVQEAVFSGGTVQISGDFTEGEARDLAKILEFGAVPVKFAVATVQTVSPTLGEDSLRAAIISGLVGVLLVVLFFFFYYRLLTIVILGGLTISFSLLWSVVPSCQKPMALHSLSLVSQESLFQLALRSTHTLFSLKR